MRNVKIIITDDSRSVKMCSEINVSPDLGIKVKEIADNQMQARVYEFQSALGGR